MTFRIPFWAWVINHFLPEDLRWVPVPTSSEETVYVRINQLPLVTAGTPVRHGENWLVGNEIVRRLPGHDESVDATIHASAASPPTEPLGARTQDDAADAGASEIDRGGAFSDEPEGIDDLCTLASGQRDFLRQYVGFYENHPDAKVQRILLAGSSGLGKTTTCRVLARCLGRELTTFTCATGRNPEQFKALLDRIAGEGKAVLLDELQGLPERLQTTLIGVLDNHPRTFVFAATTDLSRISKPVLRRFTHRIEIRPSTVQDMRSLIEKMAGVRCLKLSPDEILLVAARSRGNPSMAASILDRRMLAPEGPETLDLADGRQGLRPFEESILLSLWRAGEEPVGLSTLASQAVCSENDLSQVHERELCQLGLVAVTPRGRILTSEGRVFSETLFGSKSPDKASLRVAC